MSNTDDVGKIDSVDDDLRALLMETEFLQSQVLRERSARITVPMARDLHAHLEVACDRAATEKPDLVPELMDVKRYLEQSIRLIDGGFSRSKVNTEIQNMIILLRDIL